MRTPRRKKTPPQATATVTITALNADGIGVTTYNGKPLLVPASLPGERVRVVLEHQGQNRCFGRISGIEVKSEQRVIPGCSKAQECPGCPLIHLGYPFQLRYKEQRVNDALRQYPALKHLRPEPVMAAAATFGYRTTAKLAIAKVRGRAQVGLYRRATHEVVDIGNCPQQHPLINKVVKALREEIERQDIYVYNPRNQRGLLRYLAVRVNSNGTKALVTLVCSERNQREMIHLAKWLKKKVPEIIGVHQNINASSGNVIFGATTFKLLGADDLIDTIGAVRLRLSPSSFFQVNHTQAARIYALVEQWAQLERNDAALDMYCGVGGIAMHLARSGAAVTGVEINPEAIANAKAAARLNRLDNCRFIAADAAAVMEELSAELPQLRTAVINPPRSGCAENVLAALAALEPQTIIYVSCNPITLARDLNLLQQHGYRARQLQPVDMFPQTAHVESVVRLTRS